MENMESIMENIYDLILTYGLKLVYAIFVLLIGLWIINGVTRFVHKVMDKKALDASLRPFLKSLVKISLRIILFITVFGMLGVQMTSFIALLGAAGLAVGMALSGTLQNFAGGAIILVFKPFKVGDFIEAQGYAGFVEEIQIFNTIVKTPDNKVAIIPNGGLSTGSILNYSTKNTRRVDFTFGIGYGDDIDKAKEVIYNVARENDLILESPEPFIAVSGLADSSVNLTVRVWTNTVNYWDVYFYMTEKVKRGFDNAGVSIPFPQRDVHIHNVK